MGELEALEEIRGILSIGGAEYQEEPEELKESEANPFHIFLGELGSQK